MEHKKTGRPSKGDRDRLPVRLPKAFAAAAKQHAARRGQTFNDYVAELLAADMGMPYTDQEALSLSA